MCLEFYDSALESVFAGELLLCTEGHVVHLQVLNQLPHSLQHRILLCVSHSHCVQYSLRYYR